MTSPQAGAIGPAGNIAALRAELDLHAHRYYVLDEPSIPDSEYDQLFSSCRRSKRRIRSC